MASRSPSLEMFAFFHPSKRPRNLRLLSRPRISPLLRRRIATHTHPNHAAALSVLPNTVDTSSSYFQKNKQYMDSLVQNMQSLHDTISLGGPPKAREKHTARKKMLVRDRITALIDPGTTFMELSTLAGYDVYPGEEVAAGGIVTGVGTVEGVTCMIVANDSTVKGGTYYPITVKKHLRAQEIAEQNRLPCIYLVDSGGANLPHQADVFPDRDHFGRIFYNQANMSSKSIPQISVVLGPSTAGGAYVPSMSDETIIVNQQGNIFLGGPPLVKAAIGEVVSAEDLGGGKMHSETSGVTDYLAVDEAHGIALARRCVSNLNYQTAGSFVSSSPKIQWSEPLYDPSEIHGLLPETPSLNHLIPPHAILARLLDGSRFAEFKPLYGSSLTCGFGHLYGQPIAVLANNGILFAESALKGAHFIQLAAKRHIPLLFLQNISGFMVGLDAERGGIAKHGAKLVTAVACANVPKFTVVVGSSAGAGNYGMCGRAYSPNFLWTWPNARTSVMGPDQLSSVMKTVGKDDPALRERIERESRVEFGSARCWDDGVVVPKETRKVLGMGLRAVEGWEQHAGQEKWGVWRM
ncbi:ClpP/crotonase [Aulographum hederae CBS 113979]|uniref:methylcrotonoyl-CoA carboxylase n=1 Tax=Aulographum hederae CBS 113979 TaxID=1176131 RepID=A0A6G1GX58_9PEZI|nr:ClpP/crotonase [Aulographum hederae CBS 113979]